MTQEARFVTVDHAWSGGWSGRSLVRVTDEIDLLGPPQAVHAGLPHLPGTLLAPFTDSHVHLGLIDPTALASGGIARVDDLGWDPDDASLWPEHGRLDPRWPEVRVAGGLLCPPGGYPSRAGWAPDTASVVVSNPAGARREVERMDDLGASFVKISLNADVGPVFDDVTLRAIVDAANERLLVPVAHVQGAGQARRALDAGAARLAHTPFSERLDDELVERLAARTSWISTLDIHGHGRGGAVHDVAVANLTRFRAAGGHVLYGTDLGNGDLPLGVNARELRALQRAGLDLEQLLHALTAGAELGGTGETGRGPSRATWIAKPPPPISDAATVASDWLATATVITPDTLLEKTS
jgi:hypothetical protein